VTPEPVRRDTDISPRLARRIRIAGVLLLIGMAVEVISLMWSHPTAFLVFASVGGFFFAAGLLLYLFSMVFTRGGGHPAEPASTPRT
jgi:hypothetical protein